MAETPFFRLRNGLYSIFTIYEAEIPGKFMLHRRLIQPSFQRNFGRTQEIGKLESKDNGLKILESRKVGKCRFFLFKSGLIFLGSTSEEKGWKKEDKKKKRDTLAGAGGNTFFR